MDAVKVALAVFGTVLLLLAFLSACGARLSRRHGKVETIDLTQARTVSDGGQVLRRMVYRAPSVEAISAREQARRRVDPLRFPR